MDSRNSTGSRFNQSGSTAGFRTSQGNQQLQDNRGVQSGALGRATSVGEVGATDRYAPYMSQQNTVMRSARLPSTVNNDLEGEFYDGAGQAQALLTWSVLPENQNILIEGSSDYNILSKLQNILLALRGEFLSESGRVVITGNSRDNLDQRMILLENEIEGLMKRKINYTVKNTQGGERSLDYTNLLNEKENQIIELEKKINNLEERLRRASARELELENHIQLLNADLRRKDDVIRAKNDQILAEVAASNQFRQSLNTLRRNIDQNKIDKSVLEGVTFPDVSSFDIRADNLTKDGTGPRGSNYSTGSSAFKYRTQLVSLFREFDRLNSAEGISEADFERVLEGFLVGLRGSRLADSVNLSLESKKSLENYNNIRLKLNTALGLYKAQMERLRRENPGLRIELDNNFLDLLGNDKVTVERIDGGTVFMERYVEKTVEVPVQDSRSKYLLHLLAVELKKLSTRYPKILSEIDIRLTEFFQQELIDMIEVDEIDRIVEIVKYVPQVVKVENVYAYSSQKSRKVEFHLRILIKALLQELEKLKKRSGLVLDIDEGVIGMINQQILGIVDVDDILKVFRVVPKIVEVEKIVQKIVDRVVQVPEVIPIQKIVEKIVEVEKIKEVEKVVNVPLEVPVVVNNIIDKIIPVETIIQKIIQIPVITDKIVEVTREVPKIVEVEVVVQKIVEIEKIVEVEKEINHFVPEIKEVKIQVEKLVPVEKIVEKIVEVPTFIEKVIEVRVEVPQIIEVEKIVQKIVEKIEYKVEKELIPYVQVEHKIVERIVDRPVPIIQIEERIVQIPQIVEKIVETKIIQEVIKEVEVFRDNIIIQERIKEVEKEVPTVVTLIQEVEKVVEKIVQVPIIHQKIVSVPQIVNKPIIQRVENTIVKEVFVRDPLIVKEKVMVEVDKPVIHYVDVPRTVKHFQEKIVEVPRHIEIIKEVRVNVQKIIEKMVEVPKVVEVEKIVEKIVVVPRVIEKIVEIPQIVEVPVEKVIIQEIIREVEKIVQVPVFEERIVEVEKEKIVYVDVETVVDRVVEKVVEVPKYQEKIETVEIINERIVERVIEVPREIEVQRIVTNIVEREHVVQIQKPQVIPVEIRYPVEKIIEKLVPVYETRQVIQQIPQMIQKIVEVKNVQIQLREIPQITKEIVVDTKIVEVPSERVVVQEQIREVEVIREKPVPITSLVQEIVTVEKIVEKVIQKVVQIPKVYEVQRSVEKIVEVPQIVEIQILVPQLIRVKEYIQNIVEKIVEVPLIIERVKEIEREKEKVIQVNTTYTEIKEVQKIVEKTVILEKFKEAVKNINHIEQVLQIVDRYEQTPVPIHTKEEKLVEVPHILEKIVEKIVIMPQIVQVLKYVHDVVETENIGVAVGVDVATHEQRYTLLTKNITTNLDLLVRELNLLVKSNPNLRGQIDVILRFLAELNQHIQFPKIVQIPVEKIVERIVEKDNIIKVPVQDERSLRMQLTLSLLVEKLLIELKRLKRQNPNIQFKLDEDINLIFLGEFSNSSSIISGDFNSQLKTFSDAIQQKFETLGNWTNDHQMMLNSFLQERFVMANIVKNCNLQIQKVKSISEKRLEGLRRYKTEKMGYESHTRQLLDIIPQLISVTKQSGDASTRALANQLESFSKGYNTFLTTSVIVSQEPTRILDELSVSDERISSLLRTKDAEISKLKEQILGGGSSSIGKSKDYNKETILSLQTQNTNLKNQVSKLTSQLSDPRINASSDVRMRNLSDQVSRLQQENSNLQNDLRNTVNEYKARLNIAESQNEQLKSRIGGRSTVTPSRADIKNRGGPEFDTPETGGAQRTPDDEIKQVQSGYYGVGGTPGSSISQQSGTSTQGASNIGNTTYGRPTSLQQGMNQSLGQSMGGASQGYGSGSGRLTGSGQPGLASTYGAGGLTGNTGSSTVGAGSQRPNLQGSGRGTTGYGTGAGYTGTGTGTYGSTISGASNRFDSSNLRSGYNQPGSLGSNYGTGTGTGTSGSSGVGMGTGSTNIGSQYQTRGSTSNISGASGTSGTGSNQQPSSSSYSQFSQGRSYGNNPPKRQ